LEVRGGNDTIIRAKVASGQYGAIQLLSEEGNDLTLGYARNSSNYGSDTSAGDLSIKANSSSAVNLHFVVGSGNATTKMKIDSSGRVTMPFQPYARSSSSSLVSATNAIPLNANNLNRGGLTISGNRFTVPISGAYVVGYHHLGNSGSGSCQVEIRVNNNPIAGTRTQDTNSSNDSFGTQTVVELSANDYVEFWVVLGTVHNNSGYNQMWIWLLG
jgi:hypothetical protein